MKQFNKFPLYIRLYFLTAKWFVYWLVNRNTKTFISQFIFVDVESKSNAN